MLEQRRLLSVSLVGSTLTVNGTAGDDVATFTLSGSNLLVSDNGVNSSFATSSVNLIVFNGLDGNDNADVSSDLLINASLVGGLGNDSLKGGQGNDTLAGNDGDDSLRGWLGDDVLSGGNGNDTLQGGGGTDVIDGGNGIDLFFDSGRTGNLTIFLNGLPDDGAAGEGDNIGTSVENVRGGAGDDFIVGSNSANVLEGLDGNDTLRGVGGDDTLIGGNGDDCLAGGLGNDSLVGGEGSDTADYSVTTNAVVITLDGVANDGDPTVGEADIIGADIENVTGGGGPDYIEGNELDNVLTGNASSDTLRGQSGRDTLLGLAGSDFLQAWDEEPDVLDGGVNFDYAEVDQSSGVFDTTTIVENLVDVIAPSNLGFERVNGTEMNIFWNDNSAVENAYRVEVSTDGVNFTVADTTLADANGTTLIGLDALASYTVRVTALSGTLTSSPVIAEESLGFAASSSSTTTELTFIGVVSPSINSSNVANFGTNLPGGTYKVKYNKGGIKYNESFPYQIHNAPPSVGFRIRHSNGAGNLQAPGNSVGYNSESELYNANRDAEVQFTHSSGAIGVWLQDNPYADNEGSISFALYRVSTYVPPVRPTVSISGGGGWAVESNTSHAFTYTVSRSAPYDSYMSVSLAIQSASGSTSSFASSSDYTISGASGSLINIPYGTSSASFTISPRNDSTPEWTEKIRVSLKAQYWYNIGNANAADAEIVDDDISITPAAPSVMWVNNDDDNDNGIADKDEPVTSSISGEDDLTAFTLKYPAPLRGASVTLSGPGGKIRAWQNSNRTGLFFGGTSSSGSYTQTFGTTGAGLRFGNRVFIEAIAASATVNGTSITLSTSDANATSQPVNPTQLSTVPTPKWTNVELGLSFQTIVQDLSTNTIFVPAAALNPVVYGGSEPGTADNLKVTANLSAPSGTAAPTYRWDVSGPSQYTPPGNSATWVVGDIEPQPGFLDFEVNVRIGNGPEATFTKRIEVGIRTDDVIIVGWINPAAVPAPTPGLGVGTDIVAMFPINGVIPLLQLPIAGSLLAQLSGISAAAPWWTGFGIYSYDASPVRPNDPLGLTPLTAAERTYLLNWMFKYGANTDPRLAIPGNDFRDPANTGTSNNEVANFLSTSTNYKLFNRLQIRYRLIGSNFNGTPVILQQSVAVGTTVDPLGVPPYVHEGQIGPSMTMNAPFVTANRVSSIVDGSPVAAAVRAQNTLTGVGVPNPVFWENIGNKITFSASGSAGGLFTLPDIASANYPTHNVYVNGSFKLPMTIIQAPSPMGQFFARPYPFGPGGRDGDGSSAPNGYARVPNWTTP